MMNIKKAIFLDKDGTLMKDVPYSLDPDSIQFINGALDGLRLLQQAGYLLIVVSNQSGVARGLFDEQALARLEVGLRSKLCTHGIELLDFYYCPHHPAGRVEKYAVDCFCRKPRPGMLYRAERDYRIDMSASWLIGNTLNDVEAGNSAGCRTILLNNNHETEWKLSIMRWPDYLLNDLEEAARTITSGESIDARA